MPLRNRFAIAGNGIADHIRDTVDGEQDFDGTEAFGRIILSPIAGVMEFIRSFYHPKYDATRPESQPLTEPILNSRGEAEGYVQHIQPYVGQPDNTANQQR